MRIFNFGVNYTFTLQWQYMVQNSRWYINAVLWVEMQCSHNLSKKWNRDCWISWCESWQWTQEHLQRDSLAFMFREYYIGLTAGSNETIRPHCRRLIKNVPYQTSWPSSIYVYSTQNKIVGVYLYVRHRQQKKKVIFLLKLHF